jgi:hypothetical protein
MKSPALREAPSSDEEELEALYQKVVKSKAHFPTSAASRADLFTYLWRYRGRKSYGPELWVKALRHTDIPYEDGGHLAAERAEAERAKKPANKKLSDANVRSVSEGRVKDYSSPPDNIRERCKAVSDALDNYFEGKKTGWIIELPEGGPSKGYQLECKYRDDPKAITRAFWHPHLEIGQPVSILYAEQLFFLDADKGSLFRYYDCNAEHGPEALRELNRLHGATHPEIFNANLTPIYPYVAWGEAHASDLIVKWFRDNAFEKVDSLITRRLRYIYDRQVKQNSLILFGTISGNRFVNDILGSYTDLPMWLESRSSASIRCSLTMAELRWLEEHQQPGLYRLLTRDDAMTLEFDQPQKIAPVLVTRVSNPHAQSPRVPVTIFDTEFGSHVRTLARILTDEERLRDSLTRLDVTMPLPSSFQVLCAASVGSDEIGTVIPLLWRPYVSANF